MLVTDQGKQSDIRAQPIDHCGTTCFIQTGARELGHLSLKLRSNFDGISRPCKLRSTRHSQPSFLRFSSEIPDLAIRATKTIGGRQRPRLPSLAGELRWCPKILGVIRSPVVE